MLTVASTTAALTRVRGTHGVYRYATTERPYHLALFIYGVLFDPLSDKLVQETAMAAHLAASFVLRLCGLPLVANKAAWRFGNLNICQGDVVVVQTCWLIASTIARLFIGASKAPHDNLVHTATPWLIADIVQKRRCDSLFTANLACLSTSGTHNRVSTVTIDLTAALATECVSCGDLRRWRATFT